MVDAAISEGRKLDLVDLSYDLRVRKVGNERKSHDFREYINCFKL